VVGLPVIRVRFTGVQFFAVCRFLPPLVPPSMKLFYTGPVINAELLVMI